MHVGDLVTIWFRDTERTIFGTVENTGSAFCTIMCKGADDSETRWLVAHHDILTYGVTTNVPTKP